MIDTRNFPGHTLGTDPMDPTDPTDPNQMPSQWRAMERSGNVDDEQGSVVPVGSVVPFSEVRRALFSMPEPADDPEPVSATGGGEQNVAFEGGGEEPAASDDDDCWIVDADAAAMLDGLEEVDFDDVPVCSCGRYCDVQTLDDAWHCSQCDPAAEERRKRTSRILASVDRILRAS